MEANGQKLLVPNIWLHNKNGFFFSVSAIQKPYLILKIDQVL